jgi:hypothetical protein
MKSVPAKSLSKNAAHTSSKGLNKTADHQPEDGIRQIATKTAYKINAKAGNKAGFATPSVGKIAPDECSKSEAE